MPFGWRNSLWLDPALRPPDLCEFCQKGSLVNNPCLITPSVKWSYDSERLSSWLKQENVAGWWWGGVLPVTEILAIGPDLPRVSLPPVPIL